MNRYFFLALNRIPFLRPKERILLFDLFDDLSQIFYKLKISDLESILGRKIRSKLWNPKLTLQNAESDFKQLEIGNIRCIFYGEKDYPEYLNEIYDPPLVLFYKGALKEEHFNKPLISIVGTRKPTGAARNAAFRLGYEFAEAGIGVVSGLALGIDTYSHMGCIKNNGISHAVLGSSVDQVYPRSNIKISREILDKGGLIISEFSPGTPPLKYNFPSRNRIISGLSRSVIIIQAPEHSGALITADYALEQGRDLFVHSKGINGATGKGTFNLSLNGAKIISTANDVLVEWGISYRGVQDCKITKFKSIGLELAQSMKRELLSL